MAPLLLVPLLEYRSPASRLALGIDARMLPEPSATLPWPVEASFIAIETATTAVVYRHRGWSSIAAVISFMAATNSVQSSRRALEQERARQLGLTRETAPVQALQCLTPLIVGR